MAGDVKVIVVYYSMYGNVAEMAKSVAEVSDLAEADAVIVGTPTRFGNMCSQVRNFWDQTAGLWMKGSLIGKPAGVFTSTGSMHGGQETTLVSVMFTFIRHGMLIVGVPYSVPELVTTD